QEQVMQAAQYCAGYTLGGADLLRRAMGKKKPEEMVKQRQIFIEGAAKKDIDEATANHIFDYMEKFAGYGFNKSHAAAYALVAYQTAWLKAHYPAEFLAAVMSSEMQNTDNVVFLIDDCRKNNLEVLPPSVNMSIYQFHAIDEKTIVYGLGAIKGVGEAAMQSVINSRNEQGPYKDLFDFCHRIDLKKINKRTLEALIRAGALDCLGIERADLMVQLPQAVQAAEQARSNRETGIMDLFGEVEEVQRKPSKPVKPWSDEVRLKGEKDTLGLYLTGHPIDVYRNELKAFVPAQINELTPTRRGVTTVFAGLVVDVANFPNRMMVTLDDGTSRIEISTNHERFQRFKEIVQVDKVVVIEGEIYEREGFDRPLGRLTKAFSLNEIRQKRANSIKITLTAEHQSKTLARDLQQILQLYTDVDMSTHIPVILYLDYDYASTELHLGLNWKVAPLDELLIKLRDYFGKSAIHIEYQVKSKAARAVSYEEAKPVEVPPPPADMSIEDAMDLYQAENQAQYSQFHLKTFTIGKFMSQIDNATVSAHLSHVRIVMVNTTLPANIGSALRAMKTMGLSKLVLVAPKTYPHPDVDALAAGATDLIEPIEIVETLEDAIKDCQIVFGTSARSRTIPWPLLDVRPAASKALTAVTQEQNEVAIIFGREDRGLTNEELAMANYHLTIPVNKDYGVLNVAQAIQIICYEL